MKNIINFFILFLLATACTEVIPLELNEGDNEKLVVDAWITEAAATSKIQLSLSTSYFHNEKAPVVTDAKVEITDVTQTYALTHLGEGNYQLPTDFKGKVGVSYELKIEYKGTTYTATTTMNRVPAIDGVGYEFDGSEETEFDDGTALFSYDILLFAQEPAGEGDFYLFKTFKNGDLMEEKLEDADFVEDELVDGNYIDGASIGYGEFAVGDTIIVEMWSISEEAYDFFTAVSLETVWRGGIFDTPPANTPTNIKGGALGFFNASAVSRGMVVIEE